MSLSGNSTPQVVPSPHVPDNRAVQAEQALAKKKIELSDPKNKLYIEKEKIDTIVLWQRYLVNHRPALYSVLNPSDLESTDVTNRVVKDQFQAFTEFWKKRQHTTIPCFQARDYKDRTILSPVHYQDFPATTNIPTAHHNLLELCFDFYFASKPPGLMDEIAKAIQCDDDDVRRKIASLPADIIPVAEAALSPASTRTRFSHSQSPSTSMSMSTLAVRQDPAFSNALHQYNIGRNAASRRDARGTIQSLCSSPLPTLSGMGLPPSIPEDMNFDSTWRVEIFSEEDVETSLAQFFTKLSSKGLDALRMFDTVMRDMEILKDELEHRASLYRDFIARASSIRGNVEELSHQPASKKSKFSSEELAKMLSERDTGSLL